MDDEEPPGITKAKAVDQSDLRKTIESALGQFQDNHPETANILLDLADKGTLRARMTGGQRRQLAKKLVDAQFGEDEDAPEAD